MHRCLSLTGALRCAAVATAGRAPVRALHSVRAGLSAEPAAAAAASAASATLSPLEAGAALLNAPASAARRAPVSVVGAGVSGAKARKVRAPKLVAPLLGRVWRGAGHTGRVGGSISPDDWANVVTLNRQRLLQMKEREQFKAWRTFQQMKEARLAFLAERGEKPDEAMLARIADREAKIMEISAAARAALKAPIPPLQQVKKERVRTNRGIAMSAKARSAAQPQTYLPTSLPTEPWRVFSFRLTHYHSHLLHKQMEKFREMAKKLGLAPSYPTYLPHKVKKFTIIRGPHVDKTSREQYETRLYSLKIRISPPPEKFYAIQRLSELSFRLINGAVRMRIETPPNCAIETFASAPNPMVAANGHTPPQQYATRDSPGIENILYKFDQHQFPFLMDWQEEILDEKFRGIYEEGRDIARPFPMRADVLGEANAEEGEEALQAESPDEAVFAEEGEFQLEEDMVGEDESVDIHLDQDIPSQSEAEETLYEKHARPLVRRKRRSD